MQGENQAASSPVNYVMCGTQRSWTLGRHNDDDECMMTRDERGSAVRACIAANAKEVRGRGNFATTPMGTPALILSSLVLCGRR